MAGVDASGLHLIFDAEVALIEADIGASTGEEAAAKRAWLDRWVREFMADVPTGLKDGFRAGFSGGSRRLPADPVKRTSLLLELIPFLPYSPKFDPSGPTLKHNSKVWKTTLRAQVAKLGGDDAELEMAESAFERNRKDLRPGLNWKLVAAAAGVTAPAALFAAPIVAGGVGALMGLQGAAAVSAGLAWFGFGSLAAGGFGMLGGTIVLTGCGALLAASGSAAWLNANAKKLSPEMAVLHCAKLLTLCKFATDAKVILCISQLLRKLHFELRERKAEAKVLAVFKTAEELLNKRRKDSPDARFFRER